LKNMSGVRAITVAAHFSHMAISSMLCSNVLRLPQTREQSSLPPVIIIVFPGNWAWYNQSPQRMKLLLFRWRRRDC
jgi:hypothetical protein